jgi:hypothetical protein
MVSQATVPVTKERSLSLREEALAAGTVMISGHSGDAINAYPLVPFPFDAWDAWTRGECRDWQRPDRFSAAPFT